jgi:hypothetical protein
MPKLERWIVAQKMVQVLDAETIKRILELGGQIGGGWSLVHQHIYVTPANKEQIEALLKEKGLEIGNLSDFRHPEPKPIM